MKLLRLPAGTRDKGGRALLTVSTTSPVWSHLDCDSTELPRLLLYYTSTLRYTPLLLLLPRSLCCPPSDITSFMEQEGGASFGADGVGGCPWSCSLSRPVLRPQVAAGELVMIELPGDRSSVLWSCRLSACERKGGFTNSGVSLMFQPLRVVLFSRSHLEKHALVRDSISAPIKTMMQLLLMRNTCRT